MGIKNWATIRFPFLEKIKQIFNSPFLWLTKKEKQMTAQISFPMVNGEREFDGHPILLPSV
jgi:hypothetical protein